MTARRIALSAMLAALSCVLLFLASAAPTGALALAAFASLPVAAAIVSAGFSYGALCYAAVSAIALLLIPSKAITVLFILFFGHYPILKGLIEKLDNMKLEWLLKLIVFNLCLTVVIFGFAAFISAELPGEPVLYIAGNLVFVLYDIGYSKLITFYIQRISKHLGR